MILLWFLSERWVHICAISTKQLIQKCFVYERVQQRNECTIHYSVCTDDDNGVEEKVYALN